MSGKVITVDFRTDTLFAVERDDGVFVAVTPICDRLGIDPKKQRERIQRDPILSKGGAMMALPSLGGVQDTFCLRLDLVNGWLFTIDESRVRDEETRQRVLLYKEECYAVLFRHFYGRGVSEPQAPAAPMVTEDARRESIRIRRQLVSEARQTHGTNAARELWAYLGLPIVPAMTNPASPEFPFTYTAVKHEPSKQDDEAA